MSKTVVISDDVMERLKATQWQLMSDWSESAWCAGWMAGLEVEVWHGTNHEMTWFDPEILAIHDLAAITGIWWEYDSAVPLEEWRARHGPPLTRMADAAPTPEQAELLEQRRIRQEAYWASLAGRYRLGGEDE